MQGVCGWGAGWQNSRAVLPRPQGVLPGHNMLQVGSREPVVGDRVKSTGVCRRCHIKPSTAGDMHAKCALLAPTPRLRPPPAPSSLRQALPPELGRLQRLKLLQLDSNQLEGVPPEVRVHAWRQRCQRSSAAVAACSGAPRGCCVALFTHCIPPGQHLEVCALILRLPACLPARPPAATFAAGAARLHQPGHALPPRQPHPAGHAARDRRLGRVRSAAAGAIEWFPVNIHNLARSQGCQ